MRNARKRYLHLSFSLLAIWLCSCSTVPITGRQQFIFSSPYEEILLGQVAFQRIVAKNRWHLLNSFDSPEAGKLHSMVRRVVSKIMAAASDYYPGHITGWDYAIIRSSEANAGALPGNKLIFWKGIFKVAPDDDSLTVIVGHEVGHIIARHFGERSAHSRLIELGGRVLLESIARGHPQALNTVAITYGLVTQIGLELPFSRAQESEADRIGLVLMAKAGHDPNRAVEVWERMERSSLHAEFLSTHPSHESRVQNIKAWLPEALAYYRAPSKIERSTELAAMKAPSREVKESDVLGPQGWAGEQLSLSMPSTTDSEKRVFLWKQGTTSKLPEGTALAEAELRYERELAFAESRYGPDHPNVSTALNNLAEVYHAREKFSEAMSLYRQALAIKATEYGTNHPDVGVVLTNIARLHHAMGNDFDAKMHYQRALGILERTLGPENQTLSELRQRLLSVHGEAVR